MQTRKPKKTAAKKERIIVLNTGICETRIFKSGNSLAVRLPKSVHARPGRVMVVERAGEIIISKIPETIGDVWRQQAKLPSNIVLAAPEDDLPQKRDFQWK